MSLPRFLDKMCVSGVERLDGGENTLVVFIFLLNACKTLYK